MPPTAIVAAPMKKPIATLLWLPVLIRWPKSSGPAMPPAAVPTA